MSAMKNPRICCSVLLCAVQVCLIGCNEVKCAEKSFLYLLIEMVFTSVPGSTFTGIGLVSCSVIIWSVVWNDMCPSDATSVGSLPSWLECVLDVL